VLLPAKKKAGPNAPKCHYPRVCGTGVLAPVVAQPIQDMSAVSITAKCRSKFSPALDYQSAKLRESLSNTLARLFSFTWN
jgi:hypothetical protein